MSKLIDLTGQSFGRLTVVKRVENSITPNGSVRTMWLCKCECGKEVIRSSQNLKAAEYPSCGCWKSENTSKRKLNDLTGKPFGRLTVLRRVESDSALTKWLCRCECGNEIVVIGNNLIRGHTKSCGCYRTDYTTKAKTKHGYRHSRIYSVWSKIKDRCYNPNTPCYYRYGGIGITMCEEWKNNPESFIQWAYEHGYDENAKYGECTVERIDNSKGYSPDNCKFANATEQANNRRTNKNITYNGETHTVAEWARILNINPGTLNSGLWHGIPFEHYVNDYKPQKRN